MKSFITSLVLCALFGGLIGCAGDIPPSTALADGPQTAAPAGWVSYCVRHSEDSGCRS